MKEARYFYVPDAAVSSELPPDEAVHAVRVLRLQAGDEVFLMDGEGSFYRAEVTLSTNKKCMYRILETLPQKKTWNGNIHLAIAPTKMMERMEWLVEKATEIGFDEITFLSCRFSERREVKVPRIEKIVISAVKQSRKGWKPRVGEIQSFSDFVTNENRPGIKCIAHCYEEIPTSDFFDLLADENPSDDVTILIGPEGDFSIDEVNLALRHGYRSISLGKSRLRTETAGLMAVAMAHIRKRQ